MPFNDNEIKVTNMKQKTDRVSAGLQTAIIVKSTQLSKSSEMSY